MTLDDLYALIATDFKIDMSNLGEESIRTSALWQKYITMYSQEETKLKLMQLKLRKLEHKKYRIYSGDGDADDYKKTPEARARLRSETAKEKAIAADDEVIELETKILIQSQKVSVLANCLDECKRRGFAIKSGIEWHKFMNGA